MIRFITKGFSSTAVKSFGEVFALVRRIAFSPWLEELNEKC